MTTFLIIGAVGIALVTLTLILGDVVNRHTEDDDAPLARVLGAHGYVRLCRHDALPSYSERRAKGHKEL